jgi:precorrin-6Y C5,15-methyltransferase (decarboxylating)
MGGISLPQATKINIVGIGYRPLTDEVREVVLNSDIIICPGRLLDVIKYNVIYDYIKDNILITNNIDDSFNTIKSAAFNLKKQNITWLASGDPLFFGIGKRIIEEFGKDMVEIFPDLSCLQKIFAKIKESWDDALLISLHGRNLISCDNINYELDDIPYLIRRHRKIAVLTDRKNNPNRIAETIDNAMPANDLPTEIYVAEKLGYLDEKITHGSPKDILNMSFGEPNVVVILRPESKNHRPKPDEVAFGLKEEEIVHLKGLITKDEIRAVTIHKLRIPAKGVFWDIGAGSGAVSVEVANLCPQIKIYAVEKNEAQLAKIRENKHRFELENITPIHGEAPQALNQLPVPERVFIGGGGGKLEEIIGLVSEMMPHGIIVLNAITLKTLSEAVESFEKNSFLISVSEVCVSRSISLGPQKRYLRALNPVFIICGERW